MAVIGSGARMSVLVFAALLAACGEAGEQGAPPARERPLVIATTWPLCSFAERLAGVHADVACALAPGQDPRTWRPDRAMLEALVDADLLLLNGAGLEGWAARANLPRGRTVDTAAGFRERHLEVAEGVTHSHGPGETHTHAGTDPHTWLDPDLAILQARAVHAGLARLLPAAAPEFDAALTALVDDLRGLAAALDALPPLPDGDVLVATHPTWDYLVRRQGWPVLEVGLDPRREPSASQLELVRRRLDGRRVRAFLWEDAPAPAVADALRRAFGAASVVLEPDLERTGEQGDERRGADAVGRLRVGVEALAAALREPR